MDLGLDFDFAQFFANLVNFIWQAVAYFGFMFNS